MSTACTDSHAVSMEPPSGLWLRTEEVARQAVACGALQPIRTTVHHIEQDGVRFVVRMLAGEAGRTAARARATRATADDSANANPFLPYDPALFVTGLSATHVCLLNKFPVVERHLLVVTRAFESQETLLTYADFEALMACARQVNGLAFYNSGKVAGASQRHKHLQLAPLPLDPSGVDVPIEPLLGRPAQAGRIVHAARLPYRHALLWLPSDLAMDAEYIADSYRAMLVAAGAYGAEDTPPQPYNWLATRRWMMVVPRRAESAESMAVNALGFAGSLLVRNIEQLRWLERVGPLQMLCSVTGSPAPDTA